MLTLNLTKLFLVHMLSFSKCLVATGCVVQAYASVQLNVDLNFSDSVYGLGSGIFFLGYMVFQVNLNYLLPAVLAAKLVLEDLTLCSQSVL